MTQNDWVHKLTRKVFRGQMLDQIYSKHNLEINSIKQDCLYFEYVLLGQQAPTVQTCSLIQTNSGDICHQHQQWFRWQRGPWTNQKVDGMIPTHAVLVLKHPWYQQDIDAEGSNWVEKHYIRTGPFDKIVLSKIVQSRNMTQGPKQAVNIDTSHL